MADIGILEWVVYGLIGYTGVLMLIISTIKEVPTNRNLAGLRAIFLVPSVICNGILASSAVNIVLQTTNTITRDLNSTNTWSEAQTISFPIVDPIWQTVHYMFMIVLVVYILVQIFNAIGKTE